MAPAAAKHHLPRDAPVGRSDKQEGKGRSSVALRRLGALLVLGGMVQHFVATTPGHLITGYLFFGLGGVFVALNFVAGTIEGKGGRDER
jgi:hypothetical protein